MGVLCVKKMLRLYKTCQPTSKLICVYSTLFLSQGITDTDSVCCRHKQSCTTLRSFTFLDCLSYDHLRALSIMTMKPEKPQSSFMQGAPVPNRILKRRKWRQQKPQQTFLLQGARYPQGAPRFCGSPQGALVQRRPLQGVPMPARSPHEAAVPTSFTQTATLPSSFHQRAPTSASFAQQQSSQCSRRGRAHGAQKKWLVPPIYNYIYFQIYSEDVPLSI